MTPIYIKDGKILIRDGKIATSDSCCCCSCTGLDFGVMNDDYCCFASKQYRVKITWEITEEVVYNYDESCGDPGASDYFPRSLSSSGNITAIAYSTSGGTVGPVYFREDGSPLPNYVDIGYNNGLQYDGCGDSFLVVPVDVTATGNYYDGVTSGQLCIHNCQMLFRVLTPFGTPQQPFGYSYDFYAPIGIIGETTIVPIDPESFIDAATNYWDNYYANGCHIDPSQAICITIQNCMDYVKNNSYGSITISSTMECLETIETPVNTCECLL